MCRLFAMSAGAERARATFWLLEAPDSLAEQSHRDPDGTGLGWFDEHGTPHVRKQPIAAFEDKAFARAARTVSSHTFIAHVRFATAGVHAVRNTHPFEQDGRLFAHNGVIGELGALEAHLGEQLGRLVHGETDSERYFALITIETARAGGDVAAGITAAARWVAANLPLVSINAIVATAHELWALRFPLADELYVLERDGGAPLEARSRLGSRVRTEDDPPLVVIASEPISADPGWRALAGGELLHVGPTLRLDSSVILDPSAALITPAAGAVA